MTSAISAYISTVGPNHTIVLPKNVPIGAKVAVVVMLDEKPDEAERARTLRFEKTLEAISNVIAEGYTAPKISNEEFDALIERARHAPRL